MITNSNSKSVAKNKNIFRGEWAFLPTAFSAMAGISIGLLIGSYLGWI
ncbi:MAG: hypothetical protein ACFCU5_18970 [Pleurocapsa sp.]